MLQMTLVSHPLFLSIPIPRSNPEKFLVDIDILMVIT